MRSWAFDDLRPAGRDAPRDAATPSTSPSIPTAFGWVCGPLPRRFKRGWPSRPGRRQTAHPLRKETSRRAPRLSTSNTKKGSEA